MLKFRIVLFLLYHSQRLFIQERETFILNLFLMMWLAPVITSITSGTKINRKNLNLTFKHKAEVQYIQLVTEKT